MDGSLILSQGTISPEDRGSCLEMHDGPLFDPLNPDPDLMTPERLAVSLSNMCRFAGMVADFYAVSQHSVLVAALSPQDMPAQRMALLHDADEGFGLPDLASPVKPAFPDYIEAQNRIMACVEKRWNLNHADHARIKPADRIALIIEKMRLKSDGNMDYWQSWSPEGHLPDWIEINPLQPRAAHDLFLSAYDRVFEQNLPISRDWVLSQDGFQAKGALLNLDI